MTLDSTRTKFSTVIGAVSGITAGAGKVHEHVRFRPDLQKPEWEALYIGSAGLNAWEISLAPRHEVTGADGYSHAEADFEILAHYLHDDATSGGTPSLVTFDGLLAAVLAAIALPSNFPNLVHPPGVQLVERPIRPVLSPIGTSCFRARIAGRLWDVVQT